MRPAEDVQDVLTLAREGSSAFRIARVTGIPRSTIRDWLRDPRTRAAPACRDCGRTPHQFDRLPQTHYAYLLGMYLGDGVVSRHRNGCFRLRVKMDDRYPAIVEECAAAMRAVMPANRVLLQRIKGQRAIEISAYSKSWPCLLPQHGPGPKHLRRIVLAAWQEQIVEQQPQAFLRGLIHSDGCRVSNLVNGREYPRYLFSQVSRDIRDLFCKTCRLVEVEYTLGHPKQVSVARAASVARLDRFVGPKR